MTEMMNAQLYEERLAQARAFLVSGDDFLVVSHVQPDGDAASSTYAMGHILNHLGKRFTLVNDGSMPDKFTYMSDGHRVLNASVQTPERRFSQVIAVDCADFARIGRVREWLAEDCKLLNIDHHATNDDYGSINVVKPDAAATVEVLYDLIGVMELPWTELLAKCIYSGLLTDTGGFRYSSTSPKVMEIANRLLQLGVQGGELAEHLLERVSRAHIELLKEALSTLTFEENGRVAWMKVMLEGVERYGALPEDLDQLVNYPRNVEGVEVGMLFKETPSGTFKVSMRSNGAVDVAKLAFEFGGGGHQRAAGVTLEGPLEKAVNTLLDRLRGSL